MISEPALTEGHQTSVGTAVHLDNRYALNAAIAEAYERHAFLSCYYGNHAAAELYCEGFYNARFFDITPPHGLRSVVCLYQSDRGCSLGLAAGGTIEELSRSSFNEAVQSLPYRLANLQFYTKPPRDFEIKTTAQRAAQWGKLDNNKIVVSRLLDGNIRCGGGKAVENVDEALFAFGTVWFRRLGVMSLGCERLSCYRVWCPDLIPMFPSEKKLRQAMDIRGFAYDHHILPHPFV